MKKEAKIVLFIVLGIIIIGGLVMILRPGAPTSSVTYSPAPDEIRHIKGNTEAKVTITEFADFQCPACRAAVPLTNSIMTQYGDRVMLVFRVYPLNMHKNAVPAAIAAEAAAAQGKFWEMHDSLYEHQDEWAESLAPKTHFIAYATTLGLNVEQFKKDLDNPALKEAVTKDRDAGDKLKLQGTPTFIINGHQLFGVPSETEFKKVIDEKLNEAGVASPENPTAQDKEIIE